MYLEEYLNGRATAGTDLEVNFSVKTQLTTMGAIMVTVEEDGQHVAIFAQTDDKRFKQE